MLGFLSFNPIGGLLGPIFSIQNELVLTPGGFGMGVPHGKGGNVVWFRFKCGVGVIDCLDKLCTVCRVIPIVGLPTETATSLGGISCLLDGVLFGGDVCKVIIYGCGVD